MEMKRTIVIKVEANIQDSDFFEDDELLKEAIAGFVDGQVVDDVSDPYSLRDVTVYTSIEDLEADLEEGHEVWRDEIFIDDLRPSDYDPAPHTDHSEPCQICGRSVEDGSGVQVRMTTYGALVPFDTTLHPKADQGCFVVGPRCAEKLPDRYLGNS